MRSGRRRGARTSQKVRALLAAGVVVGLGAASTLAAWTDQENASASLTAGTFGIVGSVDGATFTEHPTSAPAQLAFSVPANGLVPGSVVYARFAVRTTNGSAAGVARLAADPANVPGDGSGLGGFLTYGVSRVTGTTCDLTAFNAGTVIVPRGSALTASPAAGTTQALAANGGSPVTYCFEVTLPTTTSNNAQGRSAAPRWTVNAENS
ncbi:MAG TPA: SipW-dependent-type signal peptide-containing protein [Microbacterium sp.]|nr:SipW-dependent-type signal peptide-containing protein [Microbacterium sp.]